jgi:hypothetical protein
MKNTGLEVYYLNPAICMSITGLEVAFTRYVMMGGGPQEAYVVAGHDASMEARRLMTAPFQPGPEWPNKLPEDPPRIVCVPSLHRDQWMLVGPQVIVVGNRHPE